MTYKSGFCGIGNCEGTRPVSSTGKAMKTCTLVGVCQCECHKEIDAMYAITDRERVVKPNPDYEPYVIDFWMPSTADESELHPLDAAPLSGSPVPHRPPEHAPPATTAPARGITEGARAYGPTPSGRRAKGLLEDEVRHVCNLFMRSEVDGPLTPKAIALYIDETDPPSVGAIDAVLKRWVALGFCEMDTKPSRFVSYTVAGMKLGLERMKADAKKKAKLQQGARKRGERV